MTNSIPLALTNAIRFQPPGFRGHNRSPSRSPIRKSLFLAKEIDPFLSNLSPDSTLRALQATSTIDEGGAGQDELAQSIADASPEEREMGIRAAVTAQKLKQWRQELEHWPWPSVKDRRSGAGFLLPQRLSISSLAVLSNTHMGYLPSNSVKEYQDKIEDVRDGLEALEFDDIKDHISSAHFQPEPVSGLEDAPGVQTKYGKLRDFTALITATVVQALPDMVQVNMLLDTWDIRLAVLRQTPSIEKDLAFVKGGIENAKATIRLENNSALPTIDAIENTKSMLSSQVLALGARIDKLLDLLEGQEDTLPKAWIDSLESVEYGFNAWVEEAELVMAQQRLGRKTLVKQPSIQIHGPDYTGSRAVKTVPRPHTVDPESTESQSSATEEESSLAELPPHETFTFPLGKKPPESSLHSRKPSLNIVAGGKGHKRDVSEVSLAESAFSGISDLSNAEIVDARSTQVLMSPKISVVENPFRNSREGMAWLMSDAANITPESTAPALHRASTTSIKVVAKESVRPVTVIRSQSLDMLSSIKPLEPSTPSRALLQLTGQDSRRSSTDSERFTIELPTSSPPHRRKSSMSRHPSLMVEPLSTKAREIRDAEELPPVPRRSSKRPIRSDSLETESRSSPSDLGEPQTPVDLGDDIDTAIADISPVRHSPQHHGSSTLEDKIKDILTTIPTRIRLENESEKKQSFFTRSAPSTRSSTPAPVLTISPAKTDRSSRKAAPGDVRLFHLTKTGQSKDNVPVKLFVRSVGENGERVMVRVGGGWADLAEYLREYSLHHGSRGLTTGQLEVASLPTKTSPKDQSSSTTAMAPAATLQDTSDAASASKRRFSLSNLSGLAGGLSRKNSHSKSSTSQEIGKVDTEPPPVPLIPSTYTSQAATPKPKKPHLRNLDTGLTRSNEHILATPNVPTVTNTPVSATTPTSYTPLGAAGPKSAASKRAASYNVLRRDSEAWVEGMMDKARAVSGGNSRSDPTSVTPSASKSRQTGRRLFGSDDQNYNRAVLSPAPGDPYSRAGTSSSRPKSRIGFGDVGSIKRVFLRRKSEKV